MNKNVKIIEFATMIITDKIKTQPKSISLYKHINTVISIDVEEIIGIIPNEPNISTLLLKNGKEFYIYGTHRTLTNRWVYALEATFNFYKDYILRPSVLIYHSPREIKHDNSFLDKEQIIKFISVLKPELLSYDYIQESLNE